VAEPLICSSKGCADTAVHQVLWNNPTLHNPDRRKIWLACDAHEASLRSFLDARDFYRETVPLQPAEG
jgi:hypothetical protein